MRVKVYNSKEDWGTGIGQLCEDIKEAGNCHCLTVEDGNEIKVFVGKNNRVYVQENFSQEELYELMNNSRTLVRCAEEQGRLSSRLYLTRLGSNYSLMGSILTQERLIDASIKMFEAVGKDVTVISFPVEIKKLYNCKAYSKISGGVRCIDLFSKDDIKEF